MFSLIQKRHKEYHSFLKTKKIFQNSPKKTSISLFSWILLFPGRLLEWCNSLLGPLLIFGTVYFHFHLQGSFQNQEELTAALLGGWKIFRSLAYTLLIIQLAFLAFNSFIFFLLGSFESIHASIKKWVINLLVITFSYALAGILIDLVYVALIIYAKITEQEMQYIVDFFFQIL